MTKYLVFKFFDKAIDWIFRSNSQAGILLKSGAAVIALPFGFQFLASLMYFGEHDTLIVRFSTDDGLPKMLSYVAFTLGALLCLCGLCIAIYRAFLDIRQESRTRLVVVEFRGLSSSPDSPAIDADFGQPRGFREWLLMDFRPKVASPIFEDPEAALNKLIHMPAHIAMKAEGRDKRDIKIAIGGMAPVPLLFLAGMLLDDESSIVLYDWDRNNKLWRTIQGDDDGKRFLPMNLDCVYKDTEEVVLAVSVSYLVDAKGVESTFPGIPVVRLNLDGMKVDCHWSEQKQIALTAQFRDCVAALTNLGVARINLILSSPASLTIRMGMAYDRRLMPNLAVYQYERSLAVPYPWGIEMPTHGVSAPSVVRLQLQG